ncbi:fucose-specific lectin [Pluteus cervinus]|uniref:Fucose-specific lectin n=1 Tax=Pluteus cervinus TaxID=181527 RepID=A0ACD3B2Y9_9AGAR|nr:fucose-specific lectin [Pluteus cervinus]
MASLNRPPLTAIKFDDDDGKHIRIYYQSPDGDIKEAPYDQHSGWSSRPENIVGCGKLNTDIGATCWANGAQIRVYFLNEEGRIIETDGRMTGKYHAAPYSRLGAVNYQNGKHIRVYYQDTSNKLREAIYRSNRGWTEGTSTLPVALPGTTLATATNPNDNGQLWVYFQTNELELQEYWYKPSPFLDLVDISYAIRYNASTPGFHRGDFRTDKIYLPGAPISAAMWNDPVKIRVLTVDETNKLCVTAWDGGWAPTQELTESAAVSDLALISVAGSTEPPSPLRLYFRNSDAGITEFASQDGTNWSEDTIAL